MKKSTSLVHRATGRVSQHLSQRLPYYLTPAEVHKLIEVTEGERDRLLLRLLWETGARISEAIGLTLGNVGRKGVLEWRN